jgi:hypothetical protein
VSSARGSRTATVAVVAGLVLLSAALPASGQGRQGRGAAQPKTPRAAAPVDLTGYWVSVITEDWRWRMVTPPKGDTASLPLNPAGLSAAKAWDPTGDLAEPCRAYGAAGIMRLPVRLHITWQDEATLRMEIDNGQQIRLFRFDRSSSPPTEPQWQGHSIAEWETVVQGQQLPPGPGRGGQQGGGIDPDALTGSLKVVTTHMKPGYLRRNGVPYSGKAVMTEFFDRIDRPGGDVWLVVTSIIDDPTYLEVPLMLSTHFKREADGAKFDPRPCEVIPPLAGTAR